jgi:hypothetical protein
VLDSAPDTIFSSSYHSYIPEITSFTLSLFISLSYYAERIFLTVVLPVLPVLPVVPLLVPY